MKKFLSFIMALSLFSVASASAEVPRALQKQIEKEAQKQTAELQRGKWELFGSSRTLEGSVIAHLTKTMNPEEGCTALTGNAQKIKVKSTGKQQAQTDAAAQYAASQVAQIKAAHAADVAADAGGFAAFAAAFAEALQREVAPAIRESYAVIRPVSPGVYDLQVVGTLSAADAASARSRALASLPASPWTAKLK